MSISRTLERVQVASAIYDYIAVGIFAFPVIASWHLGSNLRWVHDTMAFSGGYPVFDPLHLLFTNLFGAFAIMWSTLRIAKKLPVLGLCDGLLRCYYAFLMCLYVVIWQTSGILGLFIVIELFWGGWQLQLYYSLKREELAA
ncbi:MAG: hypothetical protein ACU83V_14460 [Gammaproteobacteria bacterium]